MGRNNQEAFTRCQSVSPRLHVSSYYGEVFELSRLASQLLGGEWAAVIPTTAIDFPAEIGRRTLSDADVLPMKLCDVELSRFLLLSWSDLDRFVESVLRAYPKTI